MNILFLDWKCFLRDDTIGTLEELGHRVFPFIEETYEDRVSESFRKAFDLFCDDKGIDLAFSYNYFPSLATGCKERNIPYVSFLYDSPFVKLFSFTLMYETNRVYVFDSGLADTLRRGGLKNVHYLCLPGNTRKTERLKDRSHDRKFTSSDISFIGALYNEKHTFYERLNLEKDPYLEGYLNGIMDAQSKVYGMSFLEDALDEGAIKRLQALLPVNEFKDSIASLPYIYANYFLARRLTSIERIKYLSALGKAFSKRYDLKLYTLSPSSSIPGFSVMGVAGYDTDMIHIFRESKININISLRSITNGIPLRCMDILASGGFLLSNYQNDLEREYVAGEDYVWFENEEDLVSKVDHYLSHEDERKRIAESGLRKTAELHSMKKTFEKIMAEFS